MTKQMSVTDKIKLLKKACYFTCAKEIESSDLEILVNLLNLDDLQTNFPEDELREYRDAFSGRHIGGMAIYRDDAGRIASFSFIPFNLASRSQLYSGLIFSLINPAAHNLTRILKTLSLSDYSRMGISTIAAWGALIKNIVKVKDWTRFLDTVRSLEQTLVPISSEQSTTNLLVLDALIYSKTTKPYDLSSFERHESFDFV